MAKKIDRIIVLRLGVIFLALFFITVLLLGEKAAVYNVLLGCLLGIGYGFYWLAFNVLTFEITEPDTRDIFNGFMGGLESFAGMIGPLIAGYIIAKLTTSSGYLIIFTISLVLFLIAVICSFFLERRRNSRVFQIKTPIKELQRNSNWKNIILANFSQGVREGIFMFVISILVFIVTDNEFKLGIFNFVLYFTSLIFYFIVTKWLGASKRKNAILIGSVIISLAIFIFVFNLNYASLLTYAFIIGIAYPILNVPFNSLTLDVIGKVRDIVNLRIEFIVLLELCTNIGRVISISLLIACLLWTNNLHMILLIIAIVSQAYLFIYLFMKKVDLSENKNDMKD